MPASSRSFSRSGPLSWRWSSPGDGGIADRTRRRSAAGRRGAPCCTDTSERFEPIDGISMREDSIDQWLGRLNDGDVEAVDRIYRAYEPYLRIAVRRRLSPRLRSKVDSGDIVQ